MATKTIGEISRSRGLTLRTLRFWEEKQLISPDRDGLKRLYSDEDVRRIDLIVAWSRAGFGLAEIAALLPLGDKAAFAVRARLTDLATDAHERLAAIQRLRVDPLPVAA